MPWLGPEKALETGNTRHGEPRKRISVLSDDKGMKAERREFYL